VQIFAVLYRIEQVQQAESVATSSTNFLREIGDSYQMLYGENPAADRMSWLHWSIYFGFTLLLNVVSLNLLISIISNTYDKVQQSMDAYHCKTKAETLLELATFLAVKDEEDEELSYLYIFRYSSVKLGAFENQDEWAGRIRVLTKKLDAIDQQVSGQSVEISESVKAEID